MSSETGELVVPGANTLRGGTNTYSDKTLDTNWVEGRYDPKFEGVRKHAETETMARQLEATAGRVPMYGTGLPSPEKTAYDKCIDYGNVVNYDKRESAAAWESVTRSAYAAPAEAKPTEFSTTFKSKPHLLNSDATTTAEYRKRWISGSKGAPARRFESTTGAAMSAPVARKYKTAPVRAMPGVPKAVEVFRAKILSRGVNGIRTIGRMFRIMDDSGDRQLSKSEFRYGLVDAGLSFTVDEFEALFRFLDTSKSGTVDYDEFLRGVRGDMNERRVDLVRLAWGQLEKTGDGVVTVADLEAAGYDASFHPDVQSGRITPKQALEQFMVQWDTKERDGVVTLDEFIEYYQDVSASIDDDDYFELMIRNAWHLAGGEGVTENTSNLRVLVTHADGHKSVECVRNDLGLKASDSAAIIARLAKQGVDAVAVSTHF